MAIFAKFNTEQWLSRIQLHKAFT